jgi:hypothetical protein
VIHELGVSTDEPTLVVERVLDIVPPLRRAEVGSGDGDAAGADRERSTTPAPPTGRPSPAGHPDAARIAM